jgi:1-acyl-sn-glycerol-3-phosphate acyltransferase
MRVVEWAGCLWRAIASTLSFALFGFAGVLLTLLCLPFFRCAFWLDRPKKIRLARAVVQHAFAAFIAIMGFLQLLRYQVSGRERLNRAGLLILANHPSLIDVVFLIALVPNANCVIKRGVLRNPFMRGVVRATAYIANDSGAALVEDCVQSLRQGDNLIIFPEGTRTPIDAMPKLRRGAANIAVRGARDITPVKIHTNSVSLAKGIPWWYLPRRMHYHIEVRDDIAISAFLRRISTHDRARS